MADGKLYANDVPAALEQIIWNVRKGLRKTFDDQIALLHMPKSIDFQFTVILRKDDLQRQELTSRDGITTTATSGTTIETQQRTGAVSVTDEQEVMFSARNGIEASNTAGGEGGTETTGQTETSATAGGEGGTETTGQTETSATAGGEGGTETTGQTETSATAGGEGGTETTGQSETSATAGGEGGTETTSQSETSATAGGEGGTETTGQSEVSATSGGEGGTQTENMTDNSSESGITSGGQVASSGEGGTTDELYEYSHYDADN